MFDIKSYTSVTTLEEALNCLKANPEAKVLAGGTDLSDPPEGGQTPGCGRCRYSGYHGSG